MDHFLQVFLLMKSNASKVNQLFQLFRSLTRELKSTLPSRRKGITLTLRQLVVIQPTTTSTAISYHLHLPLPLPLGFFATKTYANRFSILQLLKSRREHFGFLGLRFGFRSLLGWRLAALVFRLVYFDKKIGLFMEYICIRDGNGKEIFLVCGLIKVEFFRALFFTRFLLKSSLKYIHQSQCLSAKAAKDIHSKQVGQIKDAFIEPAHMVN